MFWGSSGCTTQSSKVHMMAMVLLSWVLWKSNDFSQVSFLKTSLGPQQPLQTTRHSGCFGQHLDFVYIPTHENLQADHCFALRGVEETSSATRKKWVAARLLGGILRILGMPRMLKDV